MDIKLYIASEIQRCELLLKRLSNVIDAAPAGSLYYRTDKAGNPLPCFSVYTKERRIQSRMDPEDTKTIRALTFKRFALHVLPKIKDYLNSLHKMKAANPVDLHREAATLGPQYRECADWAMEILRPKNPAFDALKERQNPYPFEKGCVNTRLGLFRSKNEAIDAQILASLGVEFLYEPAIVLGNRVLYPDFAVNLYWKEMIGIIEHHGRLDDPQYCARKLNDLSLWITHGFLPSINLLLLSDDPEQGFDEIRIEKQLRAFCLP